MNFAKICINKFYKEDLEIAPEKKRLLVINQRDMGNIYGALRDLVPRVKFTIVKIVTVKIQKK